jgi:GNAT superfamily N-acetyltransferase
MEGITVRPVRPGDGMGCAQAWRDAGRLYATLVPEVIHEPATEGLTDWFEKLIGAACDEPDDSTLWLVAEVRSKAGSQVVGAIEAAVAPPRADGRWQLQRDLSRTRLIINALVVTDGYRRRGVGTALLTAAEEWGRKRGATVAVTDTNLHSPLSVPFYEDRMGYLRQAVLLRKALR